MASSGMTTVKVFFVLFNLAFMVSSRDALQIDSRKSIFFAQFL